MGSRGALFSFPMPLKKHGSSSSLVRISLELFESSVSFVLIRYPNDTSTPGAPHVANPSCVSLDPAALVVGGCRRFSAALG